jgi:methionine-rich copper-binding protein CopC
VLSRVGGPEKFIIDNLHAENTTGGRFVRLRIPAQSLAPGVYHVSLTAIARDGTRSQTEEYDFVIGPNR